MSEKTSNKKDGVAARLVRCPGCKKSLVYDVNNPFRPFCSALCKNEDIVKWAEQEHRIAGESARQEPQGPGEDEGDV